MYFVFKKLGGRYVREPAGRAGFSRSGNFRRLPPQGLFFLQRNFDDLRRGEEAQRDAGRAHAVGGNNRRRFVVRVMLNVDAAGQVRPIAKHADRGVESEKRYLSAVRMSR